MTRSRTIAAALAAVSLLSAGCGSGKPPVKEGAVTGLGPHARWSNAITAKEIQVSPPRLDARVGVAISLQRSGDEDVTLESVRMPLSCVTLEGRTEDGSSLEGRKLDGELSIRLEGKYGAGSDDAKRFCVDEDGARSASSTDEVQVRVQGDPKVYRVKLATSIVMFQAHRA